jgi:hypothetical protein
MISCDTHPFVASLFFLFRFRRFSFSVCLVILLSVWVPFSQGLFSGTGELSRYTYPADFGCSFFTNDES